MVVMSSGVHDPDLLPVVRCPDGRGKGEIAFFCDRERVHIGSQCDYRPWLSAAKRGHLAGVRDRCPDVQAQSPEVVRNETGGSEFSISQFGVLMDVPAPGDELVFKSTGLFGIGTSKCIHVGGLSKDRRLCGGYEAEHEYESRECPRLVARDKAK